MVCTIEPRVKDDHKEDGTPNPLLIVLRVFFLRLPPVLPFFIVRLDLKQSTLLSDYRTRSERIQQENDRHKLTTRPLFSRGHFFSASPSLPVTQATK